MSKPSVIQQFVAALLCCVFLLAITPKKFLHDSFASHQDETGAAKHEGVQVAKAGFNCHYDNVVVSSPYVSMQHAVVLLPQHASLLRYCRSASSYAYAAASVSRLRGPPAGC